MKTYPVKDGHRTHYVKYPVLITEENAPLRQSQNGLIDKWLACDVKRDGYQLPVAPVPFETEEECQESCDIHNEYLEFTPDEVDMIIATSMNNQVINFYPPSPPSPHTKLSPAELQSGSTRVDWAEGLIQQLPKTHEGRNSWLFNYGKGQESVDLRIDKEAWMVEETESATIAQ